MSSNVSISELDRQKRAFLAKLLEIQRKHNRANKPEMAKPSPDPLR